MARILVTSDDGAQSKLWARLCEALEAKGHEVWGVAPEADQSWTGAAMTVRGSFDARKIGERKFAVEGTPADCVAAALAGLVEGGVEAVVSGINCGVNTRLPVVLASGTVGAASVAAMMGLRAVAFSYAVRREIAKEAKAAGGVLAEIEATVAAMLGHCARRVERLLGEEAAFGRVYNVNFPKEVTEATEWVEAAMAVCRVEQYVARGADGRFCAELKLEKAEGNAMGNGKADEFAVLKEGKIAEVVVEWARVGRGQGRG